MYIYKHVYCITEVFLSILYLNMLLEKLIDVEKLLNYIWFGNVIPELKKKRQKIFGIEIIFPFSLPSRG